MARNQGRHDRCDDLAGKSPHSPLGENEDGISLGWSVRSVSLGYSGPIFIRLYPPPCQFGEAELLQAPCRKVWLLHNRAECSEPLRCLLPLAGAVEAVNVRVCVVFRILGVRF